MKVRGLIATSTVIALIVTGSREALKAFDQPHTEIPAAEEGLGLVRAIELTGGLGGSTITGSFWNRPL